MDRRNFLKLTTIGAASCGAGCYCHGDEATSSFSSEDLYARFVPVDKSLPDDWLKSLVQREHPLDASIAYSNKNVDLEVIGMTVGGIGCGTVYLSGDGRLWVWDIFNQHHEGVVPNSQAKAPEGLQTIQNRSPRERGGANFLLPPRASEQTRGIEQFFELHDGENRRRMDLTGWSIVQFTGRWPIGRVDFSDIDTPVRATLEAFSPFIPLNLKDSSLPVTVMEYMVTNEDSRARTIRLTGHLNNVLGQYSGLEALRHSRRIATDHCTGLHHCLTMPDQSSESERADRILFDFEASNYEGWEVIGKAFGSRPATGQTLPGYQGNVNAIGVAFVNSHASAVTGGGVTDSQIVQARDAATGKLVSPEFTIDRRFLAFRIGGGRNPSQLAVELVVAGKAVASATGHNDNLMRDAFFDVSRWNGKRGRVVIRDDATGGWGNIGADHFRLTDVQPASIDATGQLDYGSMSLVFVGTDQVEVRTDRNEVGVEVPLLAGESATLRFLITWHVPNLNPVTGQRNRKRHYSARFADSEAVAEHVAGNMDRLTSLTRKWVETWNDSTLPQWLLDRTILTANTLQTQNSLIFEDGRFWAWEGIGCCPGTCGHVWEYAQGHARLFPQIERNLREVTDFGIAQQADGAIRFRGNNNGIFAIDSQCGYVLRTLRDQQLSDDPGYLERVWPACRQAIEYLIDFDKQDHRGGLDGLLDGEQHNTLDAEWFGKVHVLCSMYLAALRAGEELASQTSDDNFARQCRNVYELGRENIAKLFNGEFYEQIEDPEHSNAIGVGRGCYIDQVMGQFWANQVGLGRLYNAEHQKTALRSLWKYNFVPHYGRFRTAFTEGRHYASGDDSGLLMCTWPKGGLRDDFKKHWQYGYFNECMTGFEYEAAAHMVSEGDDDLVENGLAITRAIHDRYSALRGRNPYNEIECSDHYARAGASYAVFLAVGGFEFDQAKGRLAFAPVIQQEDFRTPFTTSRAWGTYQQNRQQARLKITHGSLTLNQLDLVFAGESQLLLRLNGRAVELPNLNLKQGDLLTVAVPDS